MRLYLLLSVPVAAACLAGCANPAKVAAAEATPVTPSVVADAAGDPPPALHAAPGLPAWLQALVADFDAQPARTAPSTAFALPYEGATAYLFMAPCCDEFNPLYDARGVLVCHPSGGVTGRGDGKCPAGLPPRAQWREVWRHR